MPTFKALFAVTILAVSATLLASCSWLGLGGDEGAPGAEKVEGNASGEFDIFEEFEKQEKAEGQPHEVNTPSTEAKKANPEAIAKEPTPEEAASNQASAKIQGLKAECLQALRNKDGATANTKLFALKALGVDAFPTLLDCLGELFRGHEVALEGNRHQRILGIDPHRELMTGDFYSYLAASSSSISSSMVANMFVWKLLSDPTRTVSTRIGIVSKMAASHASNEELLSLMTFVIGSGNAEQKVAWVRHLMALPSVNDQGLAGAIQSLRELKDQPMVTKLKALDADGSNPTLQLAARYTLLRTQRTKSGFLIRDVWPESAAASAGLQKGDVIVSIKGLAANNAAWLGRVKREVPFGGTVEAIIDRGGTLQRMQIVRNAGQFGFFGGLITDR